MGLIAWLTGRPDALAAPSGSREAAWEEAFRINGLPPFVADRLAAARAGTTAWTSSGSAAELLLIRRHGLRPIATVSGTCWFKSGWRSIGSPDTWGRAQMEGWNRAQARLRIEAAAAGAHAVIDTRLRQGIGTHANGEYTLLGTAIRIEGLSLPPDPIVTTLSALATSRLLLAGIVPAGLAVGAASGWNWSNVGPRALDGRGSFTSQLLPELTALAAQVRAAAIQNLISNVGPRGNQIMAQDISSDLERVERDKQPPAYFARSLAIGSVLDAPRGTKLPFSIGTVLQMNDTPPAATVTFQ